MKLLGLLLGGLLCALAIAGAALAAEPLRATTVVKVRAYHPHGKVTTGSAVLLASERLVTNCHVIATALEVEVFQGGRVWPATIAAQDRGRDLCLLRASGVFGEQAKISKTMAVGQAVYAAGYFGRERFAISPGRIVALHDYEGAQVIQVSTPFDYGASGGGLFDEHGHLIGILTFRARVGGAYHFAVPAEWIHDVQRSSAEARSDVTIAFWQQTPQRQPYFLRAMSHELNQDWDALARLGKAWTTKNPSDPRAWMALETAFRQLKRDTDLTCFGEAAPAVLPNISR